MTRGGGRAVTVALAVVAASCTREPRTPVASSPTPRPALDDAAPSPDASAGLRGWHDLPWRSRPEVVRAELARMGVSFEEHPLRRYFSGRVRHTDELDLTFTEGTRKTRLHFESGALDRVEVSGPVDGDSALQWRDELRKLLGPPQLQAPGRTLWMIASSQIVLTHQPDQPAMSESWTASPFRR